MRDPIERRSDTSLIHIDVLEEERTTRLDDRNFKLDPGRIFYHSGGAFKQDWHRYEINHADYSVRIYWGSDDLETLHEEDAYKFLVITKSRFASAAQQRLEDRAGGFNPATGRAYTPTGMRSADVA